jgi:multiple sugar transport system substrate-binding protein
MQIGTLGRRGVMLGAAALAAPRIARAATRINYWHHFTSQSEFAGLREIIALFGKAHPDITVVQENIPNPSFMAKFTAAVMSGSRPDTTMVISERLDDMLGMKGLVDISDRVKAWNLAPSFPDLAWQGISRQGRSYGTPAFTFVDWGYYRKDWFDEAGIAAPPRNYVEFVAAAKKLTDPSKGRYGFGMRGGAGGAKYVLDVMQSFGCQFVVDGKPALDRAKAIEAVTFYAGLATEQKVVPPSAPNDSYRQIMEAFRTGQTAMVWHHTGSLVEISQALKPGTQFMPCAMPAGPAAHVARLAYAYNGLMKADHADAAWDWVSSWGEPDPAIALLDQTGYFPASSVVLKDRRIADNPIYAPAVETLGFGSLPPSFVGAPGWSDNVVLPAFQGVLVGRATPEQAVDTMLRGLEQAVH